MRSNYLKRVAQVCGDDYATALERSLMAHIIEAEKALAQKALIEESIAAIAPHINSLPHESRERALDWALPKSWR